MYKATIYVEKEGKIEKVTKCFVGPDERIEWVIERLLRYKFHCVILTGEEISYS